MPDTTEQPGRAAERHQTRDAELLGRALRAARECSTTYDAILAPDQMATDRRQGRYRAAELADPQTGIAREVIERHCGLRKLPFGRHGASLAFQRYAHRLAGLAVGSAGYGGLLPDLRLTNTATVFAALNPGRTALADPRLLVAPRPADVVAVVVTGHLLPIAHAWCAVSPVALRNLQGNIAASLALGVRRLVPFLGVRPALGFGIGLFEAAPELAGLGDFRVITWRDRTGLFYERRSCCHAYAARTGKYCAWCCRLSGADRLAGFQAALQG